MAAAAPQFSHADHSVSPPRITLPRNHGAAVDLIERHSPPGAPTRSPSSTKGRKSFDAPTHTLATQPELREKYLGV